VRSQPELEIQILVKPETIGPKAKADGRNAERVEEPEKKAQEEPEKKAQEEPEKPVARRRSGRITKGK
jgi:hypothetical protein